MAVARPDELVCVLKPMRRPQPIVLSLVGLLYLGLNLSAQNPPVWPLNGRIPPQFRDRNVFVAPEGDALIILVPESSGDLRGPRKAQRFSLHTKQRPVVDVAIRDLGTSAKPFTYISLSGPRSGTPPLDFPSPERIQIGGRYSYQYVIRNDAGAEDSIEHWALVLAPETAALLSYQSADGAADWKGGWIATPGQHGPAQQAEMIGMPDGALASWNLSEGSLPLEAGDSASGFEVLSDRRPGFTTAYFRNDQSLAQDLYDAHVPEEITGDMSFLAEFKWTNSTALTLGPMFLPEASREEVVGNFRTGIARWIEKKQLDRASPFVKEADQALDAEAEGARAAAQQAEPPKEVLIQSRPGSQRETELMQALRLGLGYRFPNDELR